MPASAIQRNLQSLQAELSVKAVRKHPDAHVTGEQVHDRHQVEKAFLQSDVGDVRGPHLIYSREIAEIDKAGETFGWIPWNRGAGFLVDRP